MLRLTQAQQTAIGRMRDSRVMAQMETGAVLVAYTREHQKATMIDVDGSEFSFLRYLSELEREHHGQREEKDSVPARGGAGILATGQLLPDEIQLIAEPMV